MPVAFGLGANLGEPERQLRSAIDSLDATFGPIRVADLYRTRPVHARDQPDFLNTAATGWTSLSPNVVLAIAKVLEHAAGRRSGMRFGPRPLDIDLLLFGDHQLAEPGIMIPHPRLLERLFALVPLADVAPDWVIPGSGLTVAEALADLEASKGVARVGWSAPI